MRADTILTWWWRQKGARFPYRAKHVNAWARQARNNSPEGTVIACVTHHPKGLEPWIKVITPPGDFEDLIIPEWDSNGSLPRCHRRLAMFAPDAEKWIGSKRFLCMDMDCIITGDLTPFLDRPEPVVFARGTSSKRPYNGSMILLSAGARPQVFKQFRPQLARIASREFIGSDQAWIAWILGWGESTWGQADGVYFWGAKLRRLFPHDCPPGARVVFFPCTRKHWAIAQEPDSPQWVKEGAKT